MKKITKRENGSLRVQTVIEGESMTEQHHREMVDINKICQRARRGVMPAYAPVPPNYGDFSSGMDYQELINRTLDAKADFMQLPAYVRKRFDNDPGKLIDFMADGENLQEAIELGLVADPNKEDPVAVGTIISPHDAGEGSEGG